MVRCDGGELHATVAVWGCACAGVSCKACKEQIGAAHVNVGVRCQVVCTSCLYLYILYIILHTVPLARTLACCIIGVLPHPARRVLELGGEQRSCRYPLFTSCAFGISAEGLAEARAQALTEKEESF